VEVKDFENIRLASYYIDCVALYWHKNFMRSLRNLEVTWNGYMEALRARFGG
jgi:hypothetical protein